MPAAQKLVFEQRQVRCDFAGHLVFGTVAGEEIVDFCEQASQSQTSGHSLAQYHLVVKWRAERPYLRAPTPN